MLDFIVFKIQTCLNILPKEQLLVFLPVYLSWFCCSLYWKNQKNNAWNFCWAWLEWKWKAIRTHIDECKSLKQISNFSLVDDSLNADIRISDKDKRELNTSIGQNNTLLIKSNKNWNFFNWRVRKGDLRSKIIFSYITALNVWWISFYYLEKRWYFDLKIFRYLYFWWIHKLRNMWRSPRHYCRLDVTEKMTKESNLYTYGGMRKCQIH